MRNEEKKCVERGIAAQEQLGRMIGGFFVTQMIYVAVRLGLPDLLDRGPRSVDYLAEELSANPDGLGRLLRALSSFGVFSPAGEGGYEQSELSALLKSTGASMRHFALWAGGDWTWRPFGALEHSVRTGNPAYEEIFGCSVGEYLSSNREAAQVFSAVMTERMAPVARSVAAACEITNGKKVLDVGGGNGHLLAAILESNPDSTGVLFDLPQVVAGARAYLEEREVIGRCELIPGDFFDDLPVEGDTLVLANVVHDWGDEPAVELLRRCGSCLSKGGRLLLVEYVLPDDRRNTSPHPAKISDLIMLMTSGGKERTRAQFESLLASAGFDLVDVRPAAAGWCVVEGRIRRA